jgi:predicted HicB family RNase H-like nuclease
MAKKNKLDRRLTVRVPRSFHRSLLADAANNHASISSRILHALRGMGHPLHTEKENNP